MISLNEKKTKVSVSDLMNKRIIDMFGYEFVELQKIAEREAREKPTYVGRDEKDSLLFCKTGTISSSRACEIINWGKANKFLVKKRGKFYWNRLDLVTLSEAYWRCH